MATVRQIAANPFDPSQSIGPKTDEEKARARAGALRYVDSGEGTNAIDVDAEIVAERLVTWRSECRVENAQEEWEFSQFIVDSVRIERCARQERNLLTYEMRRAAICWDDDRRLEVEILADTLARKPAVVARKLRRSKHGCEWLLERWRALGEILERKGCWTEAQVRLVRRPPPWRVKRRFRSLPIICRSTAFVFPIPRVACRAFGVVRQVEVDFADPINRNRPGCATTTRAAMGLSRSW